MDPRTALKAVAKGKILAPAENRNLVVQLVD
jgi:hypothetical protein